MAVQTRSSQFWLQKQRSSWYRTWSTVYTCPNESATTPSPFPSPRWLYTIVNITGTDFHGLTNGQKIPQKEYGQPIGIDNTLHIIAALMIAVPIMVQGCVGSIRLEHPSWSGKTINYPEQSVRTENCCKSTPSIERLEMTLNWAVPSEMTEH